MNVLVPVAHGSESLECVTIVNVLRRAGLDVTVASIEPQLDITATRGIVLRADCLFSELGAALYDLIVLPGGERGAQALGAHTPLVELLQAQRAAGRTYAAICAAPALTLAPHGLLEGLSATCYPAFRADLPDYVDAPVVSDGYCMTSQGPATALRFALALVERFAGETRRREVADALLETV